MNVETVFLEEKEYVVLEIIKIADIEYFVLVNYENTEDFCIRKKIIENGIEYLVGLNDENEFNLIMSKFKEKRGN